MMMVMVISASRITLLASPNPTKVTVIHNYWVSRDIMLSICDILVAPSMTIPKHMSNTICLFGEIHMPEQFLNINLETFQIKS